VFGGLPAESLSATTRRCRMRITSHSIDDIHQAECAYYGDDSVAAELLNDVYASLLEDYVGWVEALREMRPS
jgi:hypothetical protein